MSAATLLLAVVCGTAFAASGIVVAVALKRAFFAAWTGSEAVITVVLVWICWALALGQLLGAVGLLRRGALLVSAVASAAITYAATRNQAATPGLRDVAPPVPDAETTVGTGAGGGGLLVAASSGGPPARPLATPAPPSRGAELALVAATTLLVLMVAAVWVTRTVIAVHRGINDPDSLGYHLPFATTFAQTGYANQHRFVLPDLPVHFYPANDELLVAIALALTHSVAFAAVKNLLYGGFIVVAAHAIGKRYRAGLLAVAGAAIALALPVIAFSQPGEAVNDALLVLVIVGGLALLAHAGDRPAPYVLAGACAGVAVGIKFSALFPAAGLGLFALVLLWSRVPAHRLRWAGAATLSAVALGGSWYLRNAITYGNPVPPTKVQIGPLQLREIATASGPKSLTVLHYLVHGRLLRKFGHGLVLGLGPLAVLVTAACVLGVIVCLVPGDAFRRLQGQAPSDRIREGQGQASGDHIRGSQGPASGDDIRGSQGQTPSDRLAEGQGPASGDDIRGSQGRAPGDGFRRGLGLFALVAAFGYIATPASAYGMAGSGLGAFVINIHYAAVALVLGLIGCSLPLARWRLAWLFPSFGVVVVATSIRPGQRIAFWSPQMGGAGFALLVGAAFVATAAVLLARWPAARRGSAAVAGGAALVALVGAALVARRYPTQLAHDQVLQWAARAHGAKVAAWVPDIALLYGPGSPNRVVTLTQLADHAPVPLASCPAWMATVIAGHYPYSAALPLTPQDQWLAADPAFRLVAKDDLAAVYQVVGRPNVSCPGQS